MSNEIKQQSLWYMFCNKFCTSVAFRETILFIIVAVFYIIGLCFVVYFGTDGFKGASS